MSTYVHHELAAKYTNSVTILAEGTNSAVIKSKGAPARVRLRDPNLSPRFASTSLRDYCHIHPVQCPRARFVSILASHLQRWADHFRALHRSVSSRASCSWASRSTISAMSHCRWTSFVQRSASPTSAPTVRVFAGVKVFEALPNMSMRPCPSRSTATSFHACAI